jgi:hypothetical protein
MGMRRKLGWKAFFVFALGVEAWAYISAYDVSEAMNWVDYLARVMVTLGVFGYAFDKRIGSALFWRVVVSRCFRLRVLVCGGGDPGSTATVS